MPRLRTDLPKLHTDITAWRRDLHETPPKSCLRTHRTSGTVCWKRLRAFGCDEVVEGIGRTGVVGVIRQLYRVGQRSSACSADMDALPIHEQTGLDYASKDAQRGMHALRPRRPTRAMLLGAAQYLAETRNFDGKRSW